MSTEQSPEQTGEQTGEKAASAPDRPGPPPVPPAPSWTAPWPGTAQPGTPWGVPPQPGPYPRPGPYGYPCAPYPVPPHGWLPPVPMRNGLGVAGMVLGIVGAVAAASVVFSFLGVPLGILALVFGAVGLRRVRRGEAANRKLAIAGLVLGGCATLASAALVVVLIRSDFFGVFDTIGPDTDRAVAVGTAVTFDDGLRVTVTGVRARGGVMDVAVRVVNGGDGTADLGSSEVLAFPERDDTDYLRKAHARGGRLPGSLDEGEEVTGHYAFVLPDGVAAVQVEVTPGLEYGTAYWWSEFDGPGGGEPAGDTGVDARGLPGAVPDAPRVRPAMSM